MIIRSWKVLKKLKCLDAKFCGYYITYGRVYDCIVESTYYYTILESYIVREVN